MAVKRRSMIRMKSASMNFAFKICFFFEHTSSRQTRRSRSGGRRRDNEESSERKPRKPRGERDRRRR